jgi:hypothetical protein
MKPERSKELRDYLQKALRLLYALPDPEADPEFNDVLQDELKQYHEKLRDALKLAFPKKESLRLLVEQDLGEDLEEIDEGKSYLDKLLNTIEWMESKGWLLMFIAAAHRRQNHSTKLNVFVRRTLHSILKSLAPAQQSPQSEVTPPPELAPFVPAPLEAHNGGGNNHGSPVSKGAIGGDVVVAQFSPVVEPSHDQPIQFRNKAVATDHQSRENPITLAHKRTQTAREKMQKIYDMFQNGEKISDLHVIDSIKEVKEALEGMSNLFDDIPIPDYPELDCRLASEEKYITQRADLIRLYALRDVNVNPVPGDLQKANGEFKKFFSSLEKLEMLIDQYQQQMQQSNQADDLLFGSGT